MQSKTNGRLSCFAGGLPSPRLIAFCNFCPPNSPSLARLFPTQADDRPAALNGVLVQGGVGIHRHRMGDQIE